MSDQKLTPQIALGHVDVAVANHRGTRADHQILMASMSTLQGVVKEWAAFKEAEKLEVLKTVPPADGEAVGGEE